MSSNREPPVILVKTWISLLNSSESTEVKNRAQKMIFGAFQDAESLAIFCKKHEILMK